MDDPKAVAELHYKMLEENNFDGWVATLTQEKQQAANVSGSSPYYWWTTGRRYVDQHGYRYKFHHEDKTGDPNRKKYFFSRLKDGKPSGMPVPIHVIKDVDGTWKVDQASY